MAEGTEAGQPWRLRAYTAIGTAGGSAAGKPLLCTEFKFGEDFGQDDFNCMVDEKGVFNGPYSTYLAKYVPSFPRSAFVGPIPDSATVEITAGTHTSKADVIDAPPELDLSNDFVVGFAPPDEDVTVIIYRTDHSVWSKEHYKTNQDDKVASEESNIGYRFSNITVAYTRDGSGGLDRTTADVKASFSWASDSYPGERTCNVIVYGRDGSVVGKYESRFDALSSTGRHTFGVPIHGEPSQAEIKCLGGRVDDPTGHYELSDFDWTAVGHGKVHFDFDAYWMGELPPAEQMCTAIFKGSGGDTLHEYQWTFGESDGQVRDVDKTEGLPSGVASEEVVGVNLSCEAYKG